MKPFYKAINNSKIFRHFEKYPNKQYGHKGATLFE